MDPDNPVVKRCAEGIALEGTDPAAARRRYEEAWAMAADDYDASIAAHYLARTQDSVEERHRWNAEALARATAVGDDRVAGFLPSLHLNLGRSCEDLGQSVLARSHYLKGLHRASLLPEDGYGTQVRNGLRAGLERCEEG